MSALGQKRTSRRSFDHLVCDQLHRGRDREAKRLGGLEVDDQLELGRPQYRKTGRAFAFQDAAGVTAELPISLRQLRAVAHQSAGDRELTPFIDRGDGLACSERDDLITVTIEEGIAGNQQRSGALCIEIRKCLVDLGLIGGANVDKLESDSPGRLFDTGYSSFSARKAGICEKCECLRLRQQFPQEPESLLLERQRKHRDPGDIAPREIETRDQTLLHRVR